MGEPIQFEFDLEKAIQAAGEVLRLYVQPIGRIRLLKSLYAANRRSIRVTGFPMLRARAAALDWGPIHSEILDAINGKFPKWFEFFSNEGDLVRLTHQPPTDVLSEFDLEAIKAAVESLGPYSDEDIINFFHNLPEYEHNYVAGTSKTIPLEEIIDAVGRSEDKADIIKALESVEQMRREMAR
jgi:hypothetical protein